MRPASIVVRQATLDDLEALVSLRMENGRVHADLEPGVYRVPDAEVVRDSFTEVLTRPSHTLAIVVLVAVVGLQVVGMAELVPSSSPPPDQILVPIPTAQIHVVVTPDSRGAGVGTRLREEVELAARDRGIQRLVAPIHTANARALDFYLSAGYGDRGRITVKPLRPPTGDGA